MIHRKQKSFEEQIESAQDAIYFHPIHYHDNV